jgi:D-3-phosphoglycerate dehydrogenase
MALAQMLGSFVGQLIDRNIIAVDLEYEGHAAQLNVKPLTACALTGLLAPQLEAINLINAPAVARERDIKVSELTREQASDFQTVIRLTVIGEDRTRRVAGSLFGADRPRIVEVEGIPIEAEPGPHMLYVRNLDKPGFIGNLGRTLGDAGINIATFHLGRTAPGEDAICLITVDQPLSEALLAKVRALPNVVKARALRF